MYVTKRQKEVLDWIKQFIDQNGFAPSYEEIARGLNLASLATVAKHIENLERKGYISRGGNRMRSIEVIPEAAKVRFRFETPERLFDSLLGIYWVKEVKP